MDRPIVSHIEILDGQAFIAGRPLKVSMVAGMYIKAGATVEQIMAQYDLTAAEVHAALAFYYDNEASFLAMDEAMQPLIQQAQSESEARLAEMRTRAASR
jgi:uncharacterized protein (DUF433 family)